MDIYGTHIPVLAAVASTVTRHAYLHKIKVLELGCGHYSTLLLHAIINPNDLLLLSTIHTYETDLSWMNRFQSLVSENHRFTHVPITEEFRTTGQLTPEDIAVWDRQDFYQDNDHLDLVFIDHRPGERRKIDIEKLQNRTTFMVVHDTEEAGYQYEPVLDQFKHRFDFKFVRPWTTVVSNFDNLAEIKQRLS